jgi:hypothetical protein
VNLRIRGQACGAVTDPVRWRGGASLNVNDDDLTFGRNQYRHGYVTLNDCRARSGETSWARRQ